MQRRTRSSDAEIALHVLRAHKNLKRNAAARVIQKHWRHGLVRPEGGNLAHRSRTVSHKGRTYNVRKLAAGFGPAELNDVEYWPGSWNVISNKNMNRIHKRDPGHMWKNVSDTKVQYLRKKQAQATAAYKKGAHAFEPYRRAGWAVIPIMYKRPSRATQRLRMVLQTRWGEKTIVAFMRSALNLYPYWPMVLGWQAPYDAVHVMSNV